MAKRTNIQGFPMPMDRQALEDRSRRPIVRRTKLGERRFPYPVPNGWFAVAESRELEPGEHRNFPAFGTDVVLFRTESGEPRLIEAYCPHQGAHLGVGGRVEGECFRCPFHGWRFDAATGACNEIPYIEDGRIPPRAKLRTYPTLERNHMIWAWHHLEGGPPFYDVPVVPEYDDPDWLPYVLREFEVATCIQEMAENDVDFAHFKFVHGSPDVPEGEMVIEGPYKRVTGMDGQFIRENFGLGLTVLRFTGVMTFTSSVLPIDEENVKLRWWFTAPRSSGENAAEELAELLVSGVSQDLPIWENKRFVEKPLLTRSEKKIVEQRKWARQFYSGL